LSLTDIISLSAATLSPKALGVSLLNLASKSGAVGSFLSKAPKLGQTGVNTLEGVEKVVRSGLGKQ